MVITLCVAASGADPLVGQHNAKLGPGDAKALLVQTCRKSMRRRSIARISFQLEGGGMATLRSLGGVSRKTHPTSDPSATA